MVAGDTSVLDAQVDLRAEFWNKQLKEGTHYKATLASSVANVQNCNANNRKHIVRIVSYLSPRHNYHIQLLPPEAQELPRRGKRQC